MPSELTLAPLQQWMQTVITHPGDVYHAVAARPAARFVDSASVGDVILPSTTLQPIQRVGIYHGMYMMRMIEALEGDYPALAHFLGYEAFEKLIYGYTKQYPSRSYTFNRFGDHLPEYISNDKLLRRRTFLYDLARLELAMTEVFDEAERAPLPSDAIASVAPEDVETIRFAAIPALRLLTFEYDANEAFQAYRDEEQIRPRHAKTCVAIYRRDYSVMRMAMTRPAFSLLRSLVAGETIGSAIRDHHRRFHRMPQQDELFNWFRDWSAAGLFASMRVSAQETK